MAVAKSFVDWLSSRQVEGAEEIYSVLKDLTEEEQKEAANASSPELFYAYLKNTIGERRKELEGALTAINNLEKDFNAAVAADPNTDFSTWWSKTATKGNTNVDDIVAIHPSRDYKKVVSEINAAGDFKNVRQLIQQEQSDLQKAESHIDTYARDVFRTFLETRQSENAGSRRTLADLVEVLAQQEVEGDDDAAELREIIEGQPDYATRADERPKLSQLVTLIKNHTKPLGEEQRIQKTQNLNAELLQYLNIRPQTTTTPGPSQSKKPERARPLVLSLILLAAFLLIVGMNYKIMGALFDEEVSGPRMFITFNFTITAVAIFFIITASVVFDIHSSSAERYDRVKTLLASLLGIFGTVLGFYFGTTDTEPPAQLELLAIERIQDPNLRPQRVRIGTAVDGGTGPYTFHIKVFDSGSNERLADETVKQQGSVLVWTFPPQGAEPQASSLRFRVRAQDADGNIAKEKSLETQATPPAAATPPERPGAPPAAAAPPEEPGALPAAPPETRPGSSDATQPNSGGPLSS
jgi:hypothetical protein